MINNYNINDNYNGGIQNEKNIKLNKDYILILYGNQIKPIKKFLT